VFLFSLLLKYLSSGFRLERKINAYLEFDMFGSKQRFKKTVNTNRIVNPLIFVAWWAIFGLVEAETDLIIKYKPFQTAPVVTTFRGIYLILIL
jgi:hypothetical protein